MSLVTFALIVAVLAPIAGIAYVVKKGLELLREARTFIRATGETSERLTRALDKLSAYEAPDTDRLAIALARAQASRERLAIELNALGRVREQWTGLLAIYPRK